MMVHLTLQPISHTCSCGCARSLPPTRKMVKWGWHSSTQLGSHCSNLGTVAPLMPLSDTLTFLSPKSGHLLCSWIKPHNLLMKESPTTSPLKRISSAMAPPGQKNEFAWLWIQISRQCWSSAVGRQSQLLSWVCTMVVIFSTPTPAVTDLLSPRENVFDDNNYICYLRTPLCHV